MNIIRRKSDGLVLYAGNVTLTDGGVLGENFRDPTNTTANTEMLDATAIPENWLGACWTYNAGVWTQVNDVPQEPTELPPPVPSQVTPLQMRKAIRASGLRALVVSYLQTADEATVEAWEYALTIERDNAMIAGAAAALGKTEAEIDDLFRLAATL